MKTMRHGLLLLALATAACGQDADSPGRTAAGLSAPQCNYFEVQGKVTICHATASAKNPVVKIRVALEACLNSHSQHAGDYIAVGDDCGPGACLAEGAPCDATLRCCGGACNAAGVCPSADLCDEVTCAALDECHEAGDCDSSNGTC